MKQGQNGGSSMPSPSNQGYFGCTGTDAWQLASDDWLAFGTRSIPTTSPFTIKLNELEELEAQREKIEEFRLLNEEAFATARQALIDSMPAEILEFWQKPESELTFQQKQLMPSILKGLVPDLTALAKTSDKSVRLDSVNLAASQGFE